MEHARGVPHRLNLQKLIDYRTIFSMLAAVCVMAAGHMFLALVNERLHDAPSLRTLMMATPEYTDLGS